MKRILIFGKEGQIGWELQRDLTPLGKIWSYNRLELDLQHHDAICKCIRDIQPHFIINAAAYTAVDKAESEREIAQSINAVAPGIIAEEAKKCGALFIHYSTDYVFDGLSQKPYVETDSTNPINFYGKTKRDGELAIQAVSGKHLILRTSWVYGTRGKNFLLTMLRLAKERELLKIVDDQIGAPTWSRLVSSITAQLTIQFTNSHNQKDYSGIYHLSSRGQTSWCGFAEEIFSHCKINPYWLEKNPIPKLEKINTSEYPLPAERPTYSILSNEKLEASFEVRMPHWKEALKLCMENKLTK